MGTNYSFLGMAKILYNRGARHSLVAHPLKMSFKPEKKNELIKATRSYSLCCNIQNGVDRKVGVNWGSETRLVHTLTPTTSSPIPIFPLRRFPCSRPKHSLQYPHPKERCPTLVAALFISPTHSLQPCLLLLLFAVACLEEGVAGM